MAFFLLLFANNFVSTSAYIPWNGGEDHYYTAKI